MCIKIVVTGESRKEKALLDTLTRRETLVVSNGPSIAVDLFRENTDVSRQFLDEGVVLDYLLAGNKLFDRDLRL
jgi:hypothetical protein